MKISSIINHLFLSVLLIICPYLAFTQNTEIDIAITRQISSLKFYHSEPVSTYENGKFVGKQYGLGITFPIYKQLRLRSEIGYTTARSYISISYFFFEGDKRIQRRIRPSWLTNERIYLGMFPELRLTSNDVDFLLNVGPLISSEISEEFKEFDVQATKDRFVFGISASAGLVLKVKSLGIKFSFGHTIYGKSKLFTENHPYLRYSNTNIGLALIFNMSWKKTNKPTSKDSTNKII